MSNITLMVKPCGKFIKVKFAILVFIKLIHDRVKVSHWNILIQFKLAGMDVIIIFIIFFEVLQCWDIYPFYTVIRLLLEERDVVILTDFYLTRFAIRSLFMIEETMLTFSIFAEVLILSAIFFDTFLSILGDIGILRTSLALTSCQELLSRDTFV